MCLSFVLGVLPVAWVCCVSLWFVFGFVCFFAWAFLWLFGFEFVFGCCLLFLRLWFSYVLFVGGGSFYLGLLICCWASVWLGLDLFVFLHAGG